MSSIYGFDTWKTILNQVIALINSNILTAGFFYVMIVRIFIDVVGSVFNKDGSRKDGN